MRSLGYACAVGALWMASSLAMSAQITVLVNFAGGDGQQPQDVILAQGRGGKLVGTTEHGGPSNDGTVFRMTPAGGFARIVNFNGSNGSAPFAGVVLARDGNFYGVTSAGGANNDGAAFKVSRAGVLNVVASFNGTNGSEIVPAVIQATDGNFYGIATNGGTSTNCSGGCGTIYKMTPGGTITTIYNFDFFHGDILANAALVQGTDGNFYGVTEFGGTPGSGTFFRVTPSGSFTILHSFQGGASEGADPLGSLIQGTDGNFYGTTSLGGPNNAGTVFKVTTTGTLTTLHIFIGTDGMDPFSPLVQGTDGNFYGTTYIGGTSTNCGLGCGTLFQITPSGVFTSLHSFDTTDGSFISGGLMQHTNGLFYGTAQEGGTSGDGTIYSLNMGLGPFIKTVTTLGKVGSTVQILGQGLTGSTSVTFNGTPATTFTIYADTYMTAIVPSGATTGPVQVTTPTGTLTSNANFRVVP